MKVLTQIAPARFGSTPSWTEHRSFRSADTVSQELVENSGAMPSRTTPKRRRSTSIPDLGQVGGSRAERKPKESGAETGFRNSAAGPFPVRKRKQEGWT